MKKNVIIIGATGREFGRPNLTDVLNDFVKAHKLI